MAGRTLAAATVKRFKKRLEEERQRLLRIIDVHEAERTEVRLAETAAERSPDPEGADGGSMAFEFEKECRSTAIPEISSPRWIRQCGRSRKERTERVKCARTRFR